MTWLRLEAPAQAMSTRSPANQPMRSLHHQPKTEKSLKLKVYFKIITFKNKTKYISKG